MGMIIAVCFGLLVCCVASIYADATITMSSGACYDFLRGCSVLIVEEPMKLLVCVITLNTSCQALKCIL